jgi:hypothetical protein
LRWFPTFRRKMLPTTSGLKWFIIIITIIINVLLYVLNN